MALLYGANVNIIQIGSNKYFNNSEKNIATWRIAGGSARMFSEIECLHNIKKIFFIGIGGISMSSLAFVCKKAGYDVAGSDRSESAMTQKLADGGIPVFIGHDEKNIDGSDAVVYTGAIHADNPELARAKRTGLPVIYRATLLGSLMKNYSRRIGFSGMHGKSSATGMTAHLFLSAGKNPTVLSGAEMSEAGGAYILGGDEYFIFEACEYMDSFLHFAPTLSVILNVGLDHTDYFSGMEQIKNSFGRYADIAVQNGGAALVNGDDENSLSATEGCTNRITFGITGKNLDYRAVNISYNKGRASFSVMRGDREIADIFLSVPGAHNIYNALAASAAGDMHGLTHDEISAGVSSFSGISRRFEYKGNAGGADVYIDYAHHPAEIAATIACARAICDGRVICAFEPHTYSRTRALYDDFISALSGADATVMLDVYAARETDTLGIDVREMAKCIKNGYYAENYAKCADMLRSLAGKNDIILILGAGTVCKIADFFV